MQRENWHGLFARMMHTNGEMVHIFWSIMGRSTARHTCGLLNYNPNISLLIYYFWTNLVLWKSLQNLVKIKKEIT